jgi:preprotein translocase subunit SecG
MVIELIEIVFIVIFVGCALLLMGLVLLQDEQGEGLGGIFGGGSSTPFGSRSGNVLTRLTSILGAIFLLTSLGLSWIKSSNEAGDVLGAAQAQRQESSDAIDWWRTPEAPAEGAQSAEDPASVSPSAAGTQAPN